jgi:predicted nucleic acid-binding protein
MKVYFESSKIEDQKGNYLVPDTNILSSCAVNPEYFTEFLKIFNKNPILIDPIIKLEFLRGAYKENTYQEKKTFLEYEKFFNMVDHQDIYKQVYNAAFNIARIYSHHGRPEVPLGDILITARLAIYDDNRMYLTADKADFSTLLFDRIDILTFEKITSKVEILEVTQLLIFNKEKYNDCIKGLPK